MVNIEADLDALFRVPLAEFTAARNALAARLKKAGLVNEAERVKSLAKPPISAWAVNQLYWKNRDAFERLIAAGERVGRAHASQIAGKAADTRGLLAARREELAGLAHLVSALLRDSGHNPTPETMRRITTTLEALSTSAFASDAPRPGRLTADVDPPGFDSLAVFIPNVGEVKRSQRPAQIIPFKPPVNAGLGKREERRLAKIAAAKEALDSAERQLHDRQSTAQNLAAALKEATAHSDEMEKDRSEAEERLQKARAAAEDARRRLRNLTADAAKAAKLLEDAVNSFTKARKEVEDLKNEADS